MNPENITALVREIENVDFQEFWWDSPLLSRAAGVKDASVVQALALRHHCLMNKKAFSAHVIRNTIKLIDAPSFSFLWQMVDSELDASRIEEHFEDLLYPPWAGAFILGEIGGAPAFEQTVGRLVPQHQARHFLLVRLLSHVLVRYLTIQEESEPQTTLIDLKTGETELLMARYEDRQNFDMQMRRRKEANEYFTPLPPSLLQQAKARLQSLPDAIFNYPKPEFINALWHLPKQYG